MLSYRHHFHAGNHADLLKHALLAWSLDALQAKPGGVVCYDTHAGAGGYRLQVDPERRRPEHLDGVTAIWPWLERSVAEGDGEPLAPYLRAVERCRAEEGSDFYPGSPLLMQQLMRQQDRAVVMELHPTEHPLLRRAIGRDSRFAIHRRDGHEGLVALLPPASGRGLVLIDPSYEQKSEYPRVVATVASARRRWAGGPMMIWYPLLSGEPHRELLAGIARVAMAPVYRIELLRHRATSRGMYGSGLLLIRPPYTVDQVWPTLIGRIACELGGGEGGSSCDWLVNEEYSRG